MATRAELEAKGWVYLGPTSFKKLQTMTYNKASLRNESGVGYFLAPNEAKKLGFAPTTTPAATTASPAASTPTPTVTPTPTTTPSPTATPAASTPPPMLTRAENEAVGNVYLGTQDAVKKAIQEGKNVQKMDGGYYIVNASRASLEAKGYTYLGTKSAVDKAIANKEVVVDFGGNKYIKPKAAVADSSALRDASGSASSGGSSSASPDTGGGSSIPGAADLGSAPTPPDLIQTYNDLVVSNSLPKLEEDLTNATNAVKELDDAYNAGVHSQENRLAPMQIIEGKQNLLRQQYLEQRATLVRTQEAAAARVTSVRNSIAMVMELTDKNYDNAATAFNNAWTRNMSTQQFLASRADAAADRAEKDTDNARATLTTLTNIIKESGKTWKEVSTTMKAQIQKLELQAGLPSGSMETFINTKPEAKLLATVNGTDASGNDIITFVYADKNGNPGTTKIIKTGGKSSIPGSGGGGSSSGTKLKSAVMKNNGEKGLAFYDEKNGNTAITAGQYAAYHKQSIVSVLKQSKTTDDQETANSMSAIFNQARTGASITADDGSSVKVTPEAAYAVAMEEFSHIFAGISYEEFLQMSGLKGV